MDKLATLQQQLQEAEDKKVALQGQVRTAVSQEQGIKSICRVHKRLKNTYVK